MEIIGKTESLCPVCFRKIAASRIAEEGRVYLYKTCPEHGEFRALIWGRDGQHYLDWAKDCVPGSGALRSATLTEKGCPFDCGLCPGHRTSACTMVMEVTMRCNLQCPVCFASSEKSFSSDPSIETIRQMYRNILSSVGVPTIQLSGGEPTVRDDLPQIVAAGREAGFEHIMVNTNGVRIAREPGYLKQLKEAGASAIYLQFDGVGDDVYRYMRGANLFETKKEAIANCAREGIGVVLVPVIIPGVNSHQLGDIVGFAKGWLNTVRGIHFQPVSYIGRYPEAPCDQDRFTIPDVIDALVEQTDGELKWRDFLPRQVDEAHCSFSSFYVLNKEGKLQSMSDSSKRQPIACGPGKEIPEQAYRSFMDAHWRHGDCRCSSPGDDFFTRIIRDSLTITCMPFQDIWNLDLERVRNCCGHVAVPDGRILPFCTYYLTNADGERLYPPVTDISRKEGNRIKGYTLQHAGAASEPADKEAASRLPATEKAVRENAPNNEHHKSGCMVCGSELIYLESEQSSPCHYCGQVVSTNTLCVHGHFVCDACHSSDAVGIILSVCLNTRETDPVALMQTIRSHAHFHMHGPEHHSLVPAVILAALRNIGHPVTDRQIITAVQRGQTIGGGACAFLGACGAAIGVGIALSLLSGADPYDGGKRQAAQQATQEALGQIASYNAPRCCQRDCWLALKAASTLVQNLTGKLLKVNYITCDQYSENNECMHDRCPLWSNQQQEVLEAGFLVVNRK